ncbi:hypothetical protein GEMRC1_014159 [Eukaryota sp. GEM-RC1]
MAKSLSLFRIIALVFINIGVEIAWASEYVFSIPLLESLDLSRSTAGYAFLSAAVLSIVALPFTGKLSDNFKSRLGKRRPFLIGLSFSVIASSLALPYVAHLSVLTTKTRIVMAFVLIGILDLSFKLIESLAHSIVIDVCPPHQQVTGNLAFSFSVGIGSVLGYFIGSQDLFKLFPVLTRYFSSEVILQFTISSLIYIICFCVTLFGAQEQSTVNSSRRQETSLIKGLAKTIKALPKTFKQLVVIQIFSWSSVFAVFQFATVFLEQLYIKEILKLLQNCMRKVLGWVLWLWPWGLASVQSYHLC